METIYVRACSLVKYTVRIECLFLQLYIGKYKVHLLVIFYLFVGSAHKIVIAERVALNFMQRMSGIATLTKVYFYIPQTRSKYAIILNFLIDISCSMFGA